MKKTTDSYTWPTPHDPGSYKCAKVFIPNDPVYFAAFWSAYEHFTKWTAWERDEENTAREVAAIWRTAFRMARAYWPDMEGECDMPYQLRDDPADPCKVQQSIDGGLTWFPAFNKNCSDTETPTVPVPQVGAGNLLFNLYVHIGEILQNGGTGADVDEWLDEVFGEDVPTFDVAPESITPENVAKLADPCLFKAAKADLEDCIDVDGVLDWLECASDTLMLGLNSVAGTLSEELNSYYATFIDGVLAQKAADYSYAGAGGGAGFGSDCSGAWGCNDLTIDPMGFHRNTPFGSWISGTGWKAGLNVALNRYELDITTDDAPAGIVGELRIDWQPSGGSKYFEIFINGVSEYVTEGGNAGFRTVTIPVEDAISSLRIFTHQNTLNTSLTVIRACFYEMGEI